MEQADPAQSKTQGGKLLGCGARSRPAGVVQWNLGGQPVQTVDMVLADAEFVFLQEVARATEGFDFEDGENFHWVLHRHSAHYRGVAVGISQDLLDCVIQKVGTSRGLWVLARVRGVGRVVLGSIHCHTGATQATYLRAAREFFAAMPVKWRNYPCMVGSDLNEQLRWSVEGDNGHLIHASLNLTEFTHSASEVGLKIQCPVESQLLTPTHFPRDASRTGRQIDAVWVRQLSLSQGDIRPDLRHCVGSDHAPIYYHFWIRRKSLGSWNNDSRARFLTGPLPDGEVLVDAQDIEEMARKYTRPLGKKSFVDPAEVKNAFNTARASMLPTDWKVAHKLRKMARKEWAEHRLQKIVEGDWGEFRSYKNGLHRRKGWWGKMLATRSSKALTEEVSAHLQEKMVDAQLVEWDEILRGQIDGIVVPSAAEWRHVSLEEVHEQLQGMKAAAAVGPDMVGVDLLRQLARHDDYGHQLLGVINHVVYRNERPEKLDLSFLALLAKKAVPAAPRDLRPICISSALGKLVNRVLAARVLPFLRGARTVLPVAKGVRYPT